MNSAGKRLSLPLLVAATATGPLALNIFTPAMPQVADHYGAPYGQVQLTLSLFFIGLAVGQVVYGPLSDRFGRRPILILGMALFTAASLLCLIAPTVELLVLARAAQGFAGCAGMVLARAVIGDVASRERSASLIAYVTMAMVVVPMIAPLSGGLLLGWYGWQAVFAVVLAYGTAVTIWLSVSQVETKHDRQPISPGAIAANYGRLLADRTFRHYAALGAFGSAGFFAFLGGAPYVIIEVMGRTPTEFGYFFIIPAGCYIAGNYVSARLVPRFGIDPLIRFGVMTTFIGVCVMFAGGLAGLMTPWAVFLPMAAYAFGNGLTIANSVAGAISTVPTIGGTASGLAGFLQMMVGAAGSWVAGSLVSQSQTPFAAVMLAVGAIAVAIAFLGRPPAVPPASVAPVDPGLAPRG